MLMFGYLYACTESNNCRVYIIDIQIKTVYLKEIKLFKPKENIVVKQYAQWCVKLVLKTFTTIICNFKKWKQIPIMKFAEDILQLYVLIGMYIKIMANM